MGGIVDVAAGALLFLFPVVMLAAAVRDVTTMTIPNWMSLVLVGTFVPAALAVGSPPMEILAHLGACAAVFIVVVGMFALRWMGGGDAKLLASASLWLGLGGLAQFLLWTALAGGLFALLLMPARKLARAAPGGPAWLERLLRPKGEIPYGVAIAAGALAAYPTSALVRRFFAGS